MCAFLIAEFTAHCLTLITNAIHPLMITLEAAAEWRHSSSKTALRLLRLNLEERQ